MAERVAGGKPEKRRTAEYAPEDITKLVYWSFMMSQGSGLTEGSTSRVHAHIFPTLLAMFPKVASSARSWTKRAKWADSLRERNFDDENFDEDGDVIKDRI